MTLHNLSTTEKSPEFLNGTTGLKRQERILDKKMEDFIVCVQAIVETTDSISLEVEELKGIRESLKSDLQNNLSLEMGKITQELKSSLHQQITESLDTNVELVQKIQREAERATSTIHALGEQHKKRFVRWGLSLVTAVCFSCFVMASGLFYFFPQQQYVRYEMTVEQAKQMLFGKSLLDNFKKLKQEDQKLLADAIEINIKQMEKKPIIR